MSPNLSSLHFAPNKLLYEQVIFNILSLIGLTRLDAIHKWSSYSKDHWDMRVSEKDLTVFEAYCASDQCYLSCKNSNCKACYHCLDSDMRLTLKDAYLEHYSKWNNKRLLPKTDLNQTHPKGLINKIQIEWYRGKCFQDSSWCTHL